MTHSHEAASVQTLTPEQLDALKALEAAATKAPWVKKGSSGDSSAYLMNEERFLAESSWHGNSAAFPTRIGTNANFDFLVAIRNVAPTLIEFAQQHAAATERAERAERERDRLDAESGRMFGRYAERDSHCKMLEAKLAEARALIARAVEAIEPLEAEANNYDRQRSDAILIELPIHLRDIRRLAALAADLRRAGEGA